MNPILQTVIITLVASLLSPTIVLLITRYLDKHKAISEVRLSDLNAIEQYQKITNEAISDMAAEKAKRTELENRVADLEAATVGPFEITMTIVTRPVPIIKSQSIRQLTDTESDTQPLKR